MESRRWALGVLGLLVAVTGLRIAAYDEPGHPLQVVMQCLLPLPPLLGAWACGRRWRLHPGWAVAAAAFLACIPALVVVYEDHEASSPGDVVCSSRGFLPSGAGDAVEPYAAVALPLIGVAATLAGAGIAVARPQWREWAAWLALAGFAAAATWFAVPVCVGT